MALVYAWTGDIGQSAQNIVDSGGSTVGSPEPNWITSRHPAVGYGGSDKVMRINAAEVVTMPVFPGGGIADCIVQCHFRNDGAGTYFSTDSPLLRILSDDPSPTILAELRAASAAGTSTLNVYTADAANILQLVYTTTGTLASNTWEVIALRFKNGASGEVEVSINGTVEGPAGPIVHSTKTAGRWGAYKTSTFTNNSKHFYTHVTGWDDPGSDLALTTTKWVASLKPNGTDTAGSYTAVGAATLHEATDDEYINTTEYAESTTSPDEVFLTIDINDIDAGWAPSIVDGIVIWNSVRGDGALNAARAAIKSGAGDKEYGSTVTTDANTQAVGSVHPDVPVTAALWDTTSIAAATIGVEVS
jgi:hypothetical protein